MRPKFVDVAACVNISSVWPVHVRGALNKYNQTRHSSLISDSASVHKSRNGWPNKLLRSAASVASDERVWKQMSNVTQRCTILGSGHRMTPWIYDWMHFEISRLCAKMPANDRTLQHAFGLVFFVWFRYKYSCGLMVWWRLNDVASRYGVKRTRRRSTFELRELKHTSS